MYLVLFWIQGDLRPTIRAFIRDSIPKDLRPDLWVTASDLLYWTVFVDLVWYPALRMPGTSRNYCNSRAEYRTGPDRIRWCNSNDGASACRTGHAPRPLRASTPHAGIRVPRRVRDLCPRFCPWPWHVTRSAAVIITSCCNDNAVMYSGSTMVIEWWYSK